MCWLVSAGQLRAVHPVDLNCLPRNAAIRTKCNFFYLVRESVLYSILGTRLKGEPMLTKQEEFLWIVQTAILANNIRLATDPEDQMRDTDKLAIYSATGTYITCDDAIYASRNIPEHLSSAKAANEFITFFLPNLRELENEAGNEQKLPKWCARN